MEAIEKELKEYLSVKRDLIKLKKRLDNSKDKIRRLVPSNKVKQVNKHSIYWANTRSRSISLIKARNILSSDVFKSIVTYGHRNSFTIKTLTKKQLAKKSKKEKK